MYLFKICWWSEYHWLVLPFNDMLLGVGIPLRRMVLSSNHEHSFRLIPDLRGYAPCSNTASYMENWLMQQLMVQVAYDKRYEVSLRALLVSYRIWGQSLQVSLQTYTCEHLELHEHLVCFLLVMSCGQYRSHIFYEGLRCILLAAKL